MYVESFHHVLKYIYMQGKVNNCKRVDKCIYTLLKISRDKAFERPKERRQRRIDTTIRDNDWGKNMGHTIIRW